MSDYKPARTFAECDAILTAPGMQHELDHAVIDGRVVRIYKNIEPTLRGIWLSRSKQFHDREYMVFEDERITYAQAHRRISDMANGLRELFGVHKGDRVAILMRNFPEWVITFWALALIGAVPVAVNVWLTDEALEHCLVQTNCKAIVLDWERADKVAPMLASIKSQTMLIAVIVARTHETNKTWPGMAAWKDVFDESRADSEGWAQESDSDLEDDGIVFFTSGTTSLPKAVLSTRRGFIQNFYSMSYIALRTILRGGGKLPPPEASITPPRIQLAVAPFFHVAGTTSILMVNTMYGGKLILMRKWNVPGGIELIKREGVTASGGVPAITIDILRSPLAGTPLARQIKQLVMGASPMPLTMPSDMKKSFPNCLFIQVYGLTETNLNGTALAGKDQIANPSSVGPPLPICDIIIVEQENNKVLKPGQVGEIWMRGSNIMRGYYSEPEATEAAITKDGWLKTGDLGYMDEEGLLYIKDRVKDMIIRGGENIHCVTVENAVLSHPAVVEVAAVGVPDSRLGELPAVFAVIKPERHIAEEELISWTRKTLPSMVVPVMVIVQTQLLERNATGKILKPKLRPIANAEWARRQALKLPAKL